MNIDTDNIWVLLWSEKQKQFHYETLAQTLSKGLDLFFDKSASDYIPLSLHSSIEEASYWRTKFSTIRDLT